MAELRLSAAAAVAIGALGSGAVAGCRSSEAGEETAGSAAPAPRSAALSVPAGWKPLPAIATAVAGAAKADRIVIDGSDAWGEPARGCYGVWLALHGGGAAADVMAGQLVTGIQGEPTLAGITLSDVLAPASGAAVGELSLAFARPPYRGRVRALIANTGTITAVACFWSPREPAACEAGCTQLVGSLR